MKTGRFSWMVATGLLVLPAPAFAVFGVGDVVIVASNPAQELLWASEELPKWIEMINEAKQQVAKAKETVDVIGHPEKFAQQLVKNVQPSLTLTKSSNALVSSKALLELTDETWKLANGPASDPDVLHVSETFESFGETVQRDSKRYVSMAKEKALRTRLEQTLKKKQAVDAQELDYQEATLNALGSSTTQAEIALHQTGLSASKQRMEVVEARVHQAEAELRAFVADTELERKKDLETHREETEAALTAVSQQLKKVETQLTRPD